LAEFRSKRPGCNGAKKIVGFPEHITSDFGSIGDFAASAELAFGTILHRSYAALGGRMHYGHPDMMNKEVMMQQGGVSKATKTLNLSEDIFAGMDFTLRGNGRSIHHREYFHLVKGRDLGFNTVLAFFSKISSGCGEQLLTRQTMRLGQLMPLPEFLTFYYAHMGYYLTQFLVSWGIPVVVLVWLVVVVNACEEAGDLSMECDDSRSPRATATILADAWQYIFSRNLLVVFLLAQLLPVFCELWLQNGLLSAIWRMLKQLVTLAPIMFIFQAKIIGSYTVNELRYGGATYVATGRGLPTERRPFIGTISDGVLTPGGLYLDYARYAYYDGIALLFMVILLILAEGFKYLKSLLLGIGVCIFLVVVSWLWAPFIFNPYQFKKQFFGSDLRSILHFFLSNRGQIYIDWCRSDKTRQNRGFRQTMLDVNFVMMFCCIILWLASMNAKVITIFHVGARWKIWYFGLLMPPLLLPLLFCIFVSLMQRLCRRRSSKRPFLPLWLTRKRTKSPHTDGEASDSSSSTASSESISDSEGLPPTPPETPSKPSKCCGKWPLWGVALGVLIGTLLELRPTFSLWHIGWRRLSLVVLLYKVFWLGFIRELVTTLVQSSCCSKWERVLEPLDLWLLSTRMVMDVLTANFIFWAMAPVVLLSCISEAVCPTWSIHHLLVYRQPGHSMRQTVEVVTSMRRGGTAAFTKEGTPQDGGSSGDSSADSTSDGGQEEGRPLRSDLRNYSTQSSHSLATPTRHSSRSTFDTTAAARQVPDAGAQL